MNELQIFNNPEFGEIRTIEIDGEPWFVGIDVAGGLGYSNPFGAVKRHVDEEDLLKREVLSKGGIQQTNLINESGLYALIIMSELPSAKKFKRWITKEVIPSIIKTGSYTLPQLTTNELVLKLAEANVEFEKRLDVVEQKVDESQKRLETTLEILTSPSKASWRDEMNYTLKQIFKDPRQRYRLYDELEKEANVTLDDRLNRLRKRMRKQGARHKDMRYVNKLDVISQDRALIPIFEGIVKRYQAEIASQICFSDNEIIVEEVV